MGRIERFKDEEKLMGGKSYGVGLGRLDVCCAGALAV